VYHRVGGSTMSNVISSASMWKCPIDIAVAAKLRWLCKTSPRSAGVGRTISGERRLGPSLGGFASKASTSVKLRSKAKASVSLSSAIINSG